MATLKHIAGNAIERDTSIDWCDTYTGTADALIEAGLVRADQLPGLPGVNKTMRTFAPDGREARKGQNFRRFPGARRIVKRGQRFAVQVTVGPDEQARRRERYEKSLEVKQQRWKFERASEKAQQHIDSLPKSHEAYRDDQATYLGWLEGAAEAVLSTSGGFSFDADTADNVRVLVGAIRQAIAEGRTQFRQADLDAQVAEIHAKARSADPDFARFLGRLGGGS